MRSPVRRVSFACAALLLGTSLAACGAETTAPGVVLSFQTDLAAPKDITHVGLYVRVISGANPGKLLKNIVFNVERDRVQLPSTYTLVSAGKPVTVRVQVVGFRTRVVDPNKGAPEPFILREAVIAVSDAAWRDRPDRFPRGRPKAPIVPAKAWINQPPSSIETSTASHTSEAA